MLFLLSGFVYILGAEAAFLQSTSIPAMDRRTCAWTCQRHVFSCETFNGRTCHAGIFVGAECHQNDNNKSTFLKS